MYRWCASIVGLVPGMVGARRVDQHPVMPGQLGVPAVDLRVIQVRLAYPGLEVVRHDPPRRPAQEFQRGHVRLHPGPLGHADAGADEQVPRVRQHHRERPDAPPPARRRVRPQPQVPVIHLGFGTRRAGRPGHPDLRGPRPLREMRPHVAAHAGHARGQARLIGQPLVDHRDRDHAHQLGDPVVMHRDLPPGHLPHAGAGHCREPLPGQCPPLLRRDRRAARRHPGRLRRGHVPADGLGIHPQAARDLHLRPSRVPVLQDLRDIDHRERPPRHLGPPSRSGRKTHSAQRTRNGTPTAPPTAPRENADRRGRELPDRRGSPTREFRDRQQAASTCATSIANSGRRRRPAGTAWPRSSPPRSRWAPRSGWSRCPAGSARAGPPRTPAGGCATGTTCAGIAASAAKGSRPASRTGSPVRSRSTGTDPARWPSALTWRPRLRACAQATSPGTRRKAGREAWHCRRPGPAAMRSGACRSRSHSLTGSSSAPGAPLSRRCRGRARSSSPGWRRCPPLRSAGACSLIPSGNGTPGGIPAGCRPWSIPAGPAAPRR